MRNSNRLLLVTAAVISLFAMASRAGNVNITATLTSVQGSGSVYDYTLTLSNTGPEAINAFWCGWIPGVFDIANPTDAGNSQGWSTSVTGNSIQYQGTALAAGSAATFTFDSTSTPAQFQSGAAGESWVYGVNYTGGEFGSTTTADMEQFTFTLGTNGTLPVITQQPESQTVLTNATVTFSVTASNVTSYQWQSNTVDLLGATNDSLILSNLIVADSATYRVVVSNSTGAVTSSNAVLVVLTVPYPTISQQPQSQTVLTNTTVTFSVTASNAAAYQWESNLVDLVGATNSSLVLSNAVPADSGNYQVVVANASGAVTSSVAVLVVGFPVSISQQPSNMDVTAGSPVTLQVAATGSPTPNYQWLFNTAPLEGQTNAELMLGAATTNLAGSYSVIVSNAFGAQTSSNAVLTVQPLTSVIKEKLTVKVSPEGAGTVSPNLNGRNLDVAHSYTITAVPARGQVFANWSGLAQSDNRSLTFVMPSGTNVVLTANFIPSPFASNNVAGAYTGLFLDTNNLADDTAGYFSATVAASGLMSGQLKLAGSTIPFSTILLADGNATLQLKRGKKSALVLTVQVDLSGTETLTGTVTDASNTFNASLTAYRAGFSKSSEAAGYNGYYTWSMTGGSGSAPAGYNYGTATITQAGGVQVAVYLSDGTTASAHGSLSTNGQMPLYVSLYGGGGSLLSWLTFTNSPIVSTVSAYWFKNAGTVSSSPPSDPYPYDDSATKSLYTSGFTLTNLSLMTGIYVPEAKGTNALAASQISVQLSGADLTSAVIQSIALNPAGLGGTNGGVTINIPDKTGLFSGSFRDPVSGKTVHFKGAVLQPASAGYGFFISDSLSGAATIQPQ
jgi:hypothetical protein